MRIKAILSSLACATLVAGCNTTPAPDEGPSPQVLAGEATELAAAPTARQSGSGSTQGAEQPRDRETARRFEPPQPGTADSQRAAPRSGTVEPRAGAPNATAIPVALTQQSGDYRLNALDVIEVSVFQVPDLTTTAQINATGLISLPLIGAVRAAGRTTTELEREVEERLGARYLQSPQVSVFVKEFNSQRVTVYGAVENQGMRSVHGPTTLMQIIAQSGGLKRIADPSGIMVFREVDGERHAAVFDMRPIERGRVRDPEIKAGDIVVVDESAVRSAWRDVREIIGAGGTFRRVALGF